MEIRLLIGSLVYMLVITIFLSNRLLLRGKVKIFVSFIYFAGLIIWPFIYMSFMRDNSFDRSAMPGFLWVLCTMLLDIYLLKYHTLEQDIVHRKGGILSMDANMICSLTFALSGILGASSQKCCQKIFTMGILCSIAFVMPTPRVPQDTLEAAIIEHFQKVCLTYSTGFLLVGSGLLLEKKLAAYD